MSSEPTSGLEEQVVAAVESKPKVVSVSLLCDPTVSYASYQNAVPLIRSIEIHNDTEERLTSVTLTVSCDPAFAEPKVYRYEILEPGERRRIQEADLKFRHLFLSELNEGVKGRVDAVVKAGETTVAEATAPVEVLAYDQWGGTRTIPELLAAFSIPNHPGVERLMFEAAELLTRAGQGFSLNGYESKNREHVWAQISAIFSAIAARSIHYSLPPASFTAMGQKIRTPDRIFEGGVATCLDLTMLMVSCLEQAGLNPLVLLRDGHSWVGCWLINTSFPTALTDDPQAVRKRIDAGELIAIESTGVANRPIPPLKAAIETGARQLHDEAEQFNAAIDIRRTRIERIEPLPSKQSVSTLAARAEVDYVPRVEAAPVLPALAGEAVLLDELGTPETPEGRLDRWRSRLLDLTLRNRLLNFKPTKVMIPLVVPSVGELEDQLAAGAEWRFRPRAKVMEGDDPRSREIARERQGADPIETMARAAMADREVLVALDRKALDDRMYEVYLTVKNNNEEGGANTLFLAIGFLKWVEDETAEKESLAPILLIPVQLHRASIRTGFYITRHDDETLINPTMIQMLRERFGIDIKGLDPLPRDDSGVDVDKILAIFRQAVKQVPRWEVVVDTYLGVFSFVKYLLWKDLKDRTEDLKTNRVVGHLIDRPREPLAKVANIGFRDDLDDRHPPQTLLAPLVADSSQLNAISRAGEGHDFVLEGPPGTGKSQTICNLISHFLGNGKSVLFLSEKMAALNVVERRMNEVGLGTFCLQLHSSKATKTEVLDQLRAARDVAQSRSSAEWEIEAERLTQLRSELNGFVRALHKDYPNGLTVRSALDKAIDGKAWKAEPIDLPTIDTLDARRLAALRDLVAGMQAVIGELGQVGRHPLMAVRRTEWSNGWEDQLLEAARELQEHAKALDQAAGALAQPLGLPLQTASAKLLGDTEALGDVLLRSADIPPTLAAEGANARVRTRLERLRVHGQKRNEAWAPIARMMRPSVAQVSAEELESHWLIASSKWWLARILAQRTIATRLASHAVDGKRPSPQSVADLIPPLKQLNIEDGVMREEEAEARRLLEDRFAGIETDWNRVQAFEIWTKSLDAALERFESLEDPAARGRMAERVRVLMASGGSLLKPGGGLAVRLVEFKKRLNDFRASVAKVAELAANPQLCPPQSAIAGILSTLQAGMQRWADNRRWLRVWCKWLGMRNQAQTFGLARVVAAVESGAIPGKDLARYADYCYAVWWVRGIIDREPMLREFSSAEHDHKIQQFRQTDERFQVLTQKYVFAKLAAGVPEADGARKASEMGVLNNELQKRQRHLPIRKLFQSMPNLLPRLKPCLLMSPLSVAQYLDAAHPKFDVVIFDEASQIHVWDAVGAIARGSQVIVVGDPKQLPPTNFFERGESEDVADDASEEAPPRDLDSILEECMGVGMSQLSLDFHYRSKSESLIDFSNKRYYGGRLVTFPAPETKDGAVKLVSVAGIYDRGATRTNRAEAEAIVARVVQHFQQDDVEARKLTMGVVTFNQPQMRLIDQLLQQELLKNPELEERMAAHGDERFFVKNLENVQGDERSIILFSITYGRDASGRMPMNFGPVNQEGGQRRLNVAVTRARDAIEIYTSVRADEIDLSKTRSKGVADLKAYLEYAVRGARSLAEESMPTGREPDSPFEREVIQVVRDAGWEVHPQVGCSGFRIDMGVVDHGHPGRYLVGIECDGATYHSLATARDRDRLRQSILEGLGWQLTRIWSTDWWNNREGTAEALLAKINGLQQAADGVPVDSKSGDEAFHSVLCPDRAQRA